MSLAVIYRPRIQRLTVQMRGPKGTAGGVASDDPRLDRNISGNYGGLKPHVLGVTITPTVTNVIAKDLDSPFNQWWWTGADWI